MGNFVHPMIVVNSDDYFLGKRANHAAARINPLVQCPWAVFGLIFQSALGGGGGKTILSDFFHMGIGNKRFARSRMFRYGFLNLILSKRQKTREGGAYSASSYGRRG